ncbi:tumor necrosis factor ligand superfamily member 8 isoform X2 [Macaca fascicularis]|uniref:tumor necrosis factor ligand superfamily member 8 isoform X2 n=1 Tax=Macaca fascicularis TaxID=9541 RepID=UPI003D15EB50
MDPGLQQALNGMAPPGDTATHVPAGSVASHLETTSRSYFYFTTATLALCLVFTVATIMVLVVQRTDSIPNSPDNIPLRGARESAPAQRENYFSDKSQVSKAYLLLHLLYTHSKSTLKLTFS